MTPKISRASKAKSKKDASLKSKKNTSDKSKKNVSDKTKRPSKSRTKSTPKTARPTGVQKVKGPQHWTKKQLEKAVNAGIERAQIELDVDDLPSKYRHVDKGDGKVPFVEGSEANTTWGNASMDESTAAFYARWRGGLGGASKRLGLGAKGARRARTAADGTAGGIMLDEDEEVDSDGECEAQAERLRLVKEDEERIAKFGGRCFFLGLPKEIREEVYGWLLIKPQSIFVLENWTAVLRLTGVTFDNNIFLVNRLIGQEATKYFYQHSSFHALIGSKTMDWRHLDWIEQRFIRNFRDVVVDVVNKSIDVIPEEAPMHESLDALRLADCQLNSLTIALSPYVVRNQMAQIALMGVVPDASRVAYANWFKKGADIHRVLTNTRGLRCREVFVVLKLKAQGKHGRIVVRINTVHLPQNFQREQIIDSFEVVKERLVRWEATAKRCVEQVAADIEQVTGWASAGLSWDGIQVRVTEYEKARGTDGADDVGPRMRVMSQDEKVRDLKWWMKDRKAEKRATEKWKLKGLTEALAQASIRTMDEMDVDELFAPLSTTAQTENGDNQQPETASDAACKPEPLPPALPGTLQAVFSAVASASEIPEFNMPDDLVTAPNPFPGLVMGRDGEVHVVAVGDVSGVADVPRDDGKVSEEGIEGEVQEKTGVLPGEEEAANEQGLFFPHVVDETQMEDESVMADDGLDCDGTGYPGALEDVAGQDVDGDQVLEEFREEMMAALEKVPAADENDFLFPPDVDADVVT